jgi:riboflavin kinase/FMN adenylyltransferase
MAYLCSCYQVKLKVYHHIDDFKHVKRPVLTTGTFDGVHRGHRTLISRLIQCAESIGGETVLLTFSPHPRMVLFPEDHGLRLLNDREEQIEQLEKAGIEHLIIHPFTRDFANLSALDYARSVLLEGVGVARMVVGYDHRFGKNREGDFALLSEYGEMLGFAVEEFPAHMVDEINVSSTKTRTAISIGDIETANRFLGYNYPLTGCVIQGDGIGRTLGFPTANVRISNPLKLIPGNGVYAIRAYCQGKTYNGMLNIGTRPTVTTANEQRIEAHLFDFDDDLYGQHLRVEVIARLRDEQKFTGTNALKSQLTEDREAALAVLLQ